jgi:hypothetical protein
VERSSGTRRLLAHSCTPCLGLDRTLRSQSQQSADTRQDLRHSTDRLSSASSDISEKRSTTYSSLEGNWPRSQATQILIGQEILTLDDRRRDICSVLEAQSLVGHQNCNQRLLSLLVKLNILANQTLQKRLSGYGDYSTKSAQRIWTNRRRRLSSATIKEPSL